MAVYPGAVWRPVQGKTNGPMRSYTGVVLHVNASNGNLYNWVANPSVDMSCHFEVYKSGAVEQYVDTANSAWCQAGGNDDYLSIETEGQPGEALTAAQCSTIAAILAWTNRAHGIPLQIADSPGDAGFGWHGMGGGAWGGHPLCPGDIRKAQRPAILALAASGNNSSTGQQGDWFDMATKDDLKAAVREVLLEVGPNSPQDVWARRFMQFLRANVTPSALVRAAKR